MKIFLTVAAAALMACNTLKPASPVKQGLTGYVYQQTGNQMPSPGKPARKPKGIKCYLYIYQPATLNTVTGAGTMFSAVNTKLVTTAQTDSLGHYSVKLPVGKYSVFISTDKSSFFADESDGTGTLNATQVLPGKVTERNWMLRRGAVY